MYIYIYVYMYYSAFINTSIPTSYYYYNTMKCVTYCYNLLGMPARSSWPRGWITVSWTM